MTNLLSKVLELYSPERWEELLEKNPALEKELLLLAERWREVRGLREILLRNPEVVKEILREEMLQMRNKNVPVKLGDFEKQSQQLPMGLPMSTGAEMMSPPGVTVGGGEVSGVQQSAQIDSDLINGVAEEITRKYPYLSKYMEQIKILNKDESNGNAIIIAEIKMPQGDYFLPAFVVHGILKPMKILFSKKKNAFIYNSKDWIELDSISTVNQIGESIKPPSTMYTDVDIRPIVIPPTTGRYSYASADLMFPDILRASGEKGRKKVKELFERNVKIAEYAYNLYGEELREALFKPTTKEKIANVFNDLDKKIKEIRETNDGVKVYTSYKGDFSKEFGENLKYHFQKLIRDGYTVKDNRDQSSLNRTITVEGPIDIKGITETGFYRVVIKDRGITDCMYVAELCTDDEYNTKQHTDGRVQSKWVTKKNNVMYLSKEDEPTQTIGYLVLDNGDYIEITNKSDPPLALKELSFSDLDPNCYLSKELSKEDNIFSNVAKKGSIEGSDPVMLLKIDKRSFVGVMLNPAPSLKVMLNKDTEGNIRFSNGNSNLINNNKYFIYPKDNPYNSFAKSGDTVILPRNLRVLKLKKRVKEDELVKKVSDISATFRSVVKNLGALVISKRDVEITSPVPRPADVAKTAEKIANQYNIPFKEAYEAVENITKGETREIFVLSPSGKRMYNEYIDNVISGSAEKANKIASLSDVIYTKVAQMLGAGPVPVGVMPPPGAMPPPDMEQAPPPGMMPPGAVPPPPAMDPGAVLAVIDAYINNLGDDYKNIEAKVNEIKKTIAILSDIKNNIASQLGIQAHPLAVEEVAQEAATVSPEAFDGVMSYFLLKDSDPEYDIGIYAENIARAIDSLAKILINIYNNYDLMADKLGPIKTNEIEDKTVKVLDSLGKYYLSIRVNLMLSDHKNIMGKI